MDEEFRKRAEERRKRIVGHIANSYEDAEAWGLEFQRQYGRDDAQLIDAILDARDLDYWQQQTPEARLSALFSARRDVENRRHVHETGKEQSS